MAAPTSRGGSTPPIPPKSQIPEKKETASTPAAEHGKKILSGGRAPARPPTKLPEGKPVVKKPVIKEEKPSKFSGIFSKKKAASEYQIVKEPNVKVSDNKRGNLRESSSEEEGPPPSRSAPVSAPPKKSLRTPMDLPQDKIAKGGPEMPKDLPPELPSSIKPKLQAGDSSKVSEIKMKEAEKKGYVYLDTQNWKERFFDADTQEIVTWDELKSKPEKQKSEKAEIPKSKEAAIKSNRPLKVAPEVLQEAERQGYTEAEEGIFTHSYLDHPKTHQDFNNELVIRKYDQAAESLGYTPVPSGISGPGLISRHLGVYTNQAEDVMTFDDLRERFPDLPKFQGERRAISLLIC